MSDCDKRFEWLALKAVPGLGGILLKRLIERFEFPRAIFNADPAEWRKIEGLGPKAAELLRTYRPDDTAILRELDQVDELEIELIPLTHPRYPALLRVTEDPPLFLYLKGKLQREDERAIAIVGARRASGYGRGVTERLARDLAHRGFTVVSGMARGIDGWAHRAALEASGRTIGVLGCGMDISYPPEHRELQKAVESQGAVLSEFSLGTQPVPENFPRRNRIISGLSLGIVVVEASERSGSLITARLGLDQGREVFAVPGPVGSRTSIGTHALIKQGAKLVENVEDIVEELAPVPGTVPERSKTDRPETFGKPALLPEEERIYKLLSAQPRHIDELTATAEFPAAKTAGVLLQLELKGTVRQLAGNLFIRTA